MTRFARAGLAVLPLLAFTASADAGDRHSRLRDCHPYNGPVGYYGNPWCDGGSYLDYGRPGPAGLRWEYSWYDDDWRHGQVRGPRRAYNYDR